MTLDRKGLILIPGPLCVKIDFDASPKHTNLATPTAKPAYNKFPKIAVSSYAKIKNFFCVNLLRGHSQDFFVAFLKLQTR